MSSQPNKKSILTSFINAIMEWLFPKKTRETAKVTPHEEPTQFPKIILPDEIVDNSPARSPSRFFKLSAFFYPKPKQPTQPTQPTQPPTPPEIQPQTNRIM